MGYASRNNPVAQQAARGELPPKGPEDKAMSKREWDAAVRQIIAKHTGLDSLYDAMKIGKEY